LRVTVVLSGSSESAALCFERTDSGTCEV
jgi:hypothetical protein